MTLVSFATFVLISEKNILDSKTAFVSLSYFNILQFPLMTIPGMINYVTQVSFALSIELLHILNSGLKYYFKVIFELIIKTFYSCICGFEAYE